MWGYQEKYATLGTIYELKKRRKRNIFLSFFKPSASISEPNLGITKNNKNNFCTKTSGKRSHSVCQGVSKIGDTALKIIVGKTNSTNYERIIEEDTVHVPDIINTSESSAKKISKLPLPKGRFNSKFIQSRRTVRPFYCKTFGHGFSIAYYKRVRLKSFNYLIADLDNNNKALKMSQFQVFK
ncbi:hypothetical protein O3M35_006577 [Rhynocoris fuscipes]|uniref:Uncharacterized protein n=1 Tax=Rhynocoris fuscipes TaxID=488301 RepID=A0AAW1DET3_9HEMI